MTIELSRAEALVLFEMLARYGDRGGVSLLLEHEAEKRVLTNSLAFPGFRSLVTIVLCATWLPWFSTSWRLSPGSPGRAGRVPWWPSPYSSSINC
jgi:hypothetical protein